MENSLSAFRRAATEGFHYVETDVHVTADEVVVVHHDPDLERITDRSGRIDRLRWSEVRSALIGGREPVCRLDDALEELPTTKFNIDVKTRDAAYPVLRTIARHAAWHRVCLASFDEVTLRLLRRVGGKRLLTSMGQQSVTLLWAGSRGLGFPFRPFVRGCAAQVPPVHGRVRVLDPRFVRTARRWGQEVHAWTVDTAAEMISLLDLGLDGLVTDRPDVLRGVLRQRGQWREQAVPLPN